MSEMPEYPTAARIIGVLFIVASVAAVVGGSLLQPAVNEDYLADAAAAEDQIIVGALLELVLAIAVIAIAVLFFPVLKRGGEGMALGYIGARTLEGVFILVGTLSGLLLLQLSLDYGPSGAAGLEPLGATLLAAREWTEWFGPMFFFSVSAVILYALLYRAQLVPAWLSVWGFVGGALLMLRAVLEMFGVDLSLPAQAVLTAPIGVNEMVLALWLIIKGFSAAPGRASEASTEPSLPQSV